MRLARRRRSPAQPPSTAAYVCELSCGNGVLDPGEACDPPSPGCTKTCRTISACTEAGGVVSPATGACYFKSAALVSYGAALLTACPSGTHLATPNGPIETEAALKATDADAWIGARAKGQPNQFSFDVSGFSLDTTRYHGFVGPDPDQGIAPACVVATHGDVRGDGWRDRSCLTMSPSLCERD